MLLEARLPFWCVSASNLHQIQQTWMSKNNHLDTSTSNAVISNYSSLRWSSRATPGNGVNMAPPLWIPATCEIDGQTLHYLLYRTAETYLWSASISSNDNTVPVGCSLPQPLPVSTCRPPKLLLLSESRLHGWSRSTCTLKRKKDLRTPLELKIWEDLDLLSFSGQSSDKAP